jgi:hypothetical protein
MLTTGKRQGSRMKGRRRFGRQHCGEPRPGQCLLALPWASPRDGL